MQLVKNHKSDYVIVIPENPTKAQRYAASELAGYLCRMSSAIVPIVTDASAPVQKEIVIGRTNREGTPCGCGLKNDGYILRSEGEKLFILGENDRGNLYGVYGLLEEQLGCRFLARGVEKIPQQGSCQPAQHRGKQQGSVRLCLAPAEPCGNQGAGDKEHEIHNPGMAVIRSGHCGKPQHQQAAASYTQAGEEPQSAAHKNRKPPCIYHRYRTPPQRRVRPSALWSHRTGILLP